MRKVTPADVTNIIKRTEVNLEWERIDPELNLTDQGADSLDMVSMMFALQEEFGVEITDESVASGEWLSIHKMVQSLNSILAQMS